MWSLTKYVVVATLVGFTLAAPNPVVVVKDVNVYVCAQAETIVPFDSDYGTGVLPSGLETCLGNQLGPTFLNPFYNQSTLDVGQGSCFGRCLTTVAKELPCIVQAIRTNNPSQLLRCGLGKPDVCACLSCLPGFAYDFIKPWCDSNAGVGDAVTSDLSDDNFIAKADDNTKAFLGVMTVSELQQLKDAAAAEMSSNNGTLLGVPLGCPFGSQRCGTCCCIGVCLFQQCIGTCV